MSSSLTETVSFVTQFRKILNSFDEVDGVLSQTGRSNDGTDPSGFYYVQCQVNLKQKKYWKRKISVWNNWWMKWMRGSRQYPGVVYNYSQPIIDNVHEAVAGINADLAVKIFGNDLEKLDKLADSTYNILTNRKWDKGSRNHAQPGSAGIKYCPG